MWTPPSNLPLADQLADIRAGIRQLEIREAAARSIG